MAARRALALAILLIVSGGCSLAGRTLGAYVDDKLVKGAVKRRLVGEGVGRRAVTVDTYEGIVYLSGVVESQVEKSDAEIAAWQVDGVEQVVNDLVVRGEGSPFPSALPAAVEPHPLRLRLPGIVRVEPGRDGGPELAYDAGGRLVATVYTLSSRELVNRDIETLRAAGRPIDHITVFPLVDRTELPVPHYAAVLWHVSEQEAAALR